MLYNNLPELPMGYQKHELPPAYLGYVFTESQMRQYAVRTIMNILSLNKEELAKIVIESKSNTD